MWRYLQIAVFPAMLAGVTSAHAGPNVQWSVQYGTPQPYGAQSYPYPPAQVYPPGVIVVPQQAPAYPPYPEPRFRSPYNDVDRDWVRQQQEREYQWRLQQEQRFQQGRPGGQSAWGRR